MSWSAITANNVLEEFTPQENASIKAIAGSTTELAAIVLRTVNKWRGAISINQAVDPTAATLPADVQPEVIAEARWRFLVKMPQLKALQTKERGDLHKEAQDLLKEIRKGQLVESATEVTVSKNSVSRPRAGRTLATTDFDKLSST